MSIIKPVQEHIQDTIHNNTNTQKLNSQQNETKQTTHITILTLRLLMSYIYIYIYIYMERLFLMFLDHTQRRTTVGRTPLDE